MNKIVVQLLVLACLTSPVFAQEAPVPRNAPRTPVNRETLVTRAAVARDVQGQATIIDGEKLRIGEADLRLFGIVPPQLSASFGPQARAALDALVANQNVNCHVRDRDHDGRLLATCRNATGSDLALELLRRGLAVSARGSLSDTDLADTYLPAEQAAQNQKIGLWSVSIAQPAPSVPLVAPTFAKEPAPAAMPVEVKKEEPKMDTARKEEVTPKLEPQKAMEKTDKSPVSTIASSTSLSSMHDMPTVIAPAIPSSEVPSFFARYQILIAGLLMLITAFGVLGVFVGQRFIERREEMKALAAALRGELLAARAVCNTRLKSIMSEEDDRDVIWPRLRATLYQAYVGRLGWLGAELARQIASIYGQSSDYATYYSAADDTRASTTPKRQALQLLIGHIEEVLPRLAVIEQTGRRLRLSVTPSRQAPAMVRVALPAMDRTVALAARAELPADMKTEILPTRPMPAKDDAVSVDGAFSSASISATTVSPDPVAVLPTAPASNSALDQVANVVVGTPAILWDTLRRFARDHFSHRSDNANDDHLPDYATLIEQDIAHMSFGDLDDDTTPLNDVRKTGGV